jgi:hypothetical protein
MDIGQGNRQWDQAIIFIYQLCSIGYKALESCPLPCPIGLQAIAWHLGQEPTTIFAPHSMLSIPGSCRALIQDTRWKTRVAGENPGDSDIMVLTFVFVKRISVAPARSEVIFLLARRKG